jgi:uncharacterized hydrophobic protein (TIGR00341 family)
MALQLVKIITELRFEEKLDEFMQRQDSVTVFESWKHADKRHKRLYLSFITRRQSVQMILDKIDAICGRISDTHALVLPVTASLSPEVKKIEAAERRRTISKTVAISREELYSQVAIGTELNVNFILLVIFSTIVAVLGLLENNITVVIGAMLIAPMLGPNLAMSLATTLGDVKLMMQSIRTNVIGIFVCVILSIFIGMIWPYGFKSFQLLIRTDVSYDSLVLAFVSGAAAVLSITAGVSSALVGVMVSAALLPAMATFGIMIGKGHFYLATGAGLLVAVNIVCINLAANITFICKGIRPSRWYEKRKATRAVRWNLVFWTFLLLALALVIYVRHGWTFFEMFH